MTAAYWKCSFEVTIIVKYTVLCLYCNHVIIGNPLSLFSIDILGIDVTVAFEMISIEEVTWK